CYVTACRVWPSIAPMPRSGHPQPVSQPAEDRVQLVGAPHSADVKAPFALGENERVSLFAADGTVPPGLVLEVDLPALLERAERDKVARRLERVQARKLREQAVRVVVP